MADIRPRLCPADGCKNLILYPKAFCAECWKHVPPLLQEHISISLTDKDWEAYHAFLKHAVRRVDDARKAKRGKDSNEEGKGKPG